VTSEPARVFFALWPETGVREALAATAQEAQAECGGRAMVAGKIHTTLFFIGDIERSRIPRLEAIAATIRGAPFDLDVDALQYWKHNRMVWAGAKRCPAPLSALVSSLSAALATEGLRGEDRPYVAHVTLVRNARRAPRLTTLTPLCWAARDFVLAESVRASGVSRYDVLARWPLDASV
jgi:2'-5' RNA ligase